MGAPGAEFVEGLGHDDYANAAAGLLVPLALVALARVIDHPRSSWRAVAACLLLTGAVATLSRAGILVLVAGLAALVGLLGVRRSFGAIAAVLAGSAVAVAGLIPSVPAESSPRAGLAVATMAIGLGVSGFGVTRRARSRHLALAVSPSPPASS